MRRGFVIAIIIFALFIVWIQPLDLGKREVTIPKGATGHEIMSILASNHIIRSRNEMLLWLRLLNKEKTLKFGTYKLAQYKNPLYYIHELSFSAEKEIVVTIPEGLTIDETAAILESRALIDRDIFTGLCADRKFIKEMGYDAATLEGYLFPDTYFFSGSQSETTICRIMLKNFKTHMRGLKLDASDSLREILIIASLVEKEARFDDERPLIADVFVNRLKIRRPLESCATVIYALKASGNPRFANYTALLERDLKFSSPYNTYLHMGLPPGPICSPGARSIQAARQPASTDYLYFVLMGNGRHYFSRSYKEHLAAKDKYRAQD
jgi:UPF0755 protein